MYKTKTISYDVRVKTFWTLISILVLCLGVYVYMINATVRNTVARQNLESQMANLSARVGEMEFSYISLENKVSLAVAYERGFQNVASPTYISRASSRSFSMNVPTSNSDMIR